MTPEQERTLLCLRCQRWQEAQQRRDRVAASHDVSPHDLIHGQPSVTASRPSCL